jgi:hypothetical protein
MKLYSKTANQELEVDVMTKEQNGQVLTVIKHASLQDIIYNQLAICKGPENISIDLLSHNPYPVYRCTIWDKERDRYAVGIGSGKPETLAAGIASDYADESASNRAFDRAAITYLQFPGRQLSEEEVGIFLPGDLISSVDTPIQDEEQPMVNEPVPTIKSAPITQTTEGDFANAMNPPVEPEAPAAEETNVEQPVENTPAPTDASAVDAATVGAKIISFGKYSSNPLTVAEACDHDLDWVLKCVKITHPSDAIKDDIEALRAYVTAKVLI